MKGDVTINFIGGTTPTREDAATKYSSALVELGLPFHPLASNRDGLNTFLLNQLLPRGADQEMSYDVHDVEVKLHLEKSRLKFTFGNAESFPKTEKFISFVKAIRGIFSSVEMKLSVYFDLDIPNEASEIKMKALLDMLIKLK